MPKGEQPKDRQIGKRLTPQEKSRRQRDAFTKAKAEAGIEAARLRRLAAEKKKAERAAARAKIKAEKAAAKAAARAAAALAKKNQKKDR